MSIVKMLCEACGLVFEQEGKHDEETNPWYDQCPRCNSKPNAHQAGPVKYQN